MTAVSVLNEAEAAWSSGDIERCLSLCAAAAPADEQQVALRLLRLHVDSLRLLRQPEAAVALARRFQVPAGSAGHANAAASLGLALVWAGELAAAEPVLRDALLTAGDLDEREDATILLALRYFLDRRFGEARDVLATIEARDNTNYARRLEIEAWIAFHCFEFETAMRTFERALAHLDGVPHDKRLELNILVALADYAVESLDIDRWLPVARRLVAHEPIPTCLWWHYYAVHNCLSLTAEIVGHPNAALEQAGLMCHDDLPIVTRILGLCRKAAILGRYGERLAQRDVARTVRRAYLGAAIGKPVHPLDTMVFPVVAETCTIAGDLDAAQSTMDDWERVSLPQTPYRGSPIFEGQREYVRGLIADARGESLRARHHYQAAVDLLLSLGYHRQGIIVAQRLAEMESREDLLRYIDRHARRLSPRSWLRRRFASTISRSEQPLLAQLSRAEREVLEMLTSGMTTAQIAGARGRSEKTVRNSLSALYKAFGVENRQALLCECIRRGMVTFGDEPGA